MEKFSPLSLFPLNRSWTQTDENKSPGERVRAIQVNLDSVFFPVDLARSRTPLSPVEGRVQERYKETVSLKINSCASLNGQDKI